MKEAANRDGRTVLYVSHNMNTIRQLCDRCIVLDQGKVVFEGMVDEAIELYMGLRSESPEIVSFDEVKRKRKDLVEGIKISEIRIVDHKIWKIKVGEKLRFNLTVKATKTLRDIGYRSRVTTVDGNSVSVLLAPKLITCQEGDVSNIPLEADLSELVPGRYAFTPVLYGANEYGGWQFYDHIDAAIVLEVENQEGFNENMPWEQRWWGNVKLPELIDLRKK